MNMNIKNADEMTSEERVQEIVSILANALVRTINTKQKQPVERSFAGLQTPSKRSYTKQNKYRKRG